MVIDEGSRHTLYIKLEEVLGPQEASTLMAHLPPVGWADVATKQDLELRLESQSNALMAGFRAELMASERHILVVVVSVVTGLNLTLAGLAFAAAKLL